MDPTRTLSSIEPFNQLPAAAIAALAAAAVLKTYPPQTYFFHQHDSPTGYLYVIRSGLVEIVALAPAGVEMVVDYRRDGSFFGGTPFLTNDPYTAGARTVTETDCYLIPDQLLAELARQHPQLMSFFTKAILTRVRSLYSDMVSEHTRNALGQVEAFPFQKRLSEIMSLEIVSCSPETSVDVVARRMTQKKVGAILVSSNENPVCGIVTEHDLVSKVLVQGQSLALKATAADVMTPDPYFMPPDTFMYEATAFMTGRNIKYMPVLADGEVVGMVTLQNLLKYRSQKSMLLVGGVNEAKTLAELAQIKLEMAKIAKAFMGEARSPVETMEILSYLHHCILRRGFEIVLEMQLKQGRRLPEVRFCFFLMGSGGRKEMLLGPDQDNGFIFEDYPDKQHAEIQAFFVPFAEQLVTAYAKIGYPLCNGKVMVNNPLWCGRLAEWERRLNTWIGTPEPQRVRYSNNFFDYLPLVGDATLCLQLRDIVQRQIKQNPLFLFQLMELNFSHKVPLGLMGGFVLEKEGEHKGQVPLKQTGSLFIVDCLRIFSLEQQLGATTTSERLDQLVGCKLFNTETAEHLKAAFQAFTFLRLRQEIKQLEQGLLPQAYVDPASLNKNEQDLLKEAYRAASKLQDATKRHFARFVN